MANYLVSSVSGYFHQLGTGGTIIVVVILFIVLSWLRMPWER